MRPRSLAFLAFLFLVITTGYAQIERPVTWNFRSEPAGKDEANLILTATIEDHWHIYSQHIEEGGPIPTSFKFTPTPDFELVGDVKEESKAVKAFDPTFQMNIIWFENKAVFKQRVKMKNTSATIKGSLEFMVCNDEKCLPPEEVEFSIPVTIPAVKTGATTPDKTTTPAKATEQKTEVATAPKQDGVATPVITPPATTPAAEQKDTATVVATTATPNVGQSVAEHVTYANEVKQESRSLWSIFIAGFLGGLAAILMPCIFPMLPFTVSFFTKQGGGVGRAALYGISIIVIYTVLGMLITVAFGSAMLNELSTNGIFNFFFFLLLVVFGASFLGAFEIQLPSSWANKADAQADRGGLLGIFFMAATLALVSFSCTGPIIGTLLVEAASRGNLLGPTIGMFGFSLALALPFTLFAMFPSWLNKMPKSGGWLNSVKVTLGFLELALALKFLSNVDLAYHWQWFDREVFLVLWIIIFGLMGLYLLGKLRLPHDSALQHISTLRLFLAIFALAFSLYMIPGLWGAPLKAISPFLPPQHTQDFDLYTAMLENNQPIAGGKTVETGSKKYSDIFEAPLGLNAFFDYEEGMAYARKVKKPVMIDFTGHACVNCRKMETTVWPDKQVLNRLRQDYVLIQLYVDDKTSLPETEQTISTFSGKKIKTIGNKWSDLQASRFQANSQPYYVLLDNNETILAPPRGAEDYNIEDFTTFLDKGKNAFSSQLN